MAAPGWYDDPDQTGTLRYFDGEQWTEQRSWAPTPRSPEDQQRRDRRLAALAHVGIPIGSVLVPFALWHTSAPHSFVRTHARQSFTFQLIFLGVYLVLFGALLWSVTFGTEPGEWATLPVALGIGFVLQIPQAIRALTGRLPIRLLPWSPLPE